MQKAQLHTSKGFSMVEMILSIAIFLVFVTSVSGLIYGSWNQTRNAINKERATYLAKEAIELSRNLRDSDYTNLVDGIHGLSLNGNTWEFSGSSDNTDIFTRNLTVLSISENQKQLTSVVEWPDYNGINSVTLSTYLTNFRKITPPPGLTVNKTVINHGLTNGIDHFAPYNATANIMIGDPPELTEIVVALTPGEAVEFEHEGNYTISESIDSAYSTIFTGDCDEFGQITLANGDAKICNITNEEKPSQLTVTKVVNGGIKQVSDFSLFVDGSPVVSGETNVFNSGLRVVSETLDPEYDLSFSGDCNLSGQVTLISGATKSCTLTNTYNVPSSTVIFVGANSNGGSTITIPAHQVGDLLVIFAYRDGNASAPTLPTGWTNIGTAGGANSNASRLAYRVATVNNTVSGTWTGATGLVVHVYRGQNTSTPIGANADTGSSSTTITYPALTLVQNNGSSWVAGFAGHRSINTSLQLPPSGMTNRTNFVNTTNEVSGHDTNGGVASWVDQNVSVGGTSSGWRARTLEIMSQ